MLLPSCVTHEVQVDLAEIEYMDMIVGVSTRSVYVELEYLGHPCVLFADDITAEVRTATEAIPIPISGGGEAASETGDCIPFQLWLDSPPAADPASFVLADSSGEISVDLGGFLLPATASLVPAGPWNLASNQTYTVALSQRAAFAEAFGTSVKLAGDPAAPSRTLPSRIVGDTLVFTTPSDLPTSGQGTLSMTVSGPQITAWTCAPSSWGCELALERIPVTQAITFVP